MTSKAAQPLGIFICGESGRMGLRVAELARRDSRFRLVGGLDKGGKLPEAFGRADVVVDFSTPDASPAFAQEAARAAKPIVIGTTGFTPEALERMRIFSRRCPLFLSPNLSPGANLLFFLTKSSASVLKGYDVSIVETHHKMKKDSPSGTAKRLAQACSEIHPRRHAVSILSQRIGDVVGDHTLTLAGPHERIELTHRAHSRDLFAQGALEAALWLRGRRPGLYDMLDLMGLK